MKTGGKSTTRVKRRMGNGQAGIFFLKDRLEKNFPDRVNSTRRRRRRLPELYKGDLWAYCDWRKGGVSRSIDFRKWACRARFADHRFLDAYIYIYIWVFLFVRKGPLPLPSPNLTNRERVNWLNVSCTRVSPYFIIKRRDGPLGNGFFLARTYFFPLFYCLLPS